MHHLICSLSVCLSDLGRARHLLALLRLSRSASLCDETLPHILQLPRPDVSLSDSARRHSVCRQEIEFSFYLFFSREPRLPFFIFAVSVEN